MAYIGKIKITKEWAKVEDLIQDQISGQSAFSFSSDSAYQIQGESDYGVRLVEQASAPTDMNEGNKIVGTQCAYYKPESGYLYVRTGVENELEGFVKISTVGE